MMNLEISTQMNGYESNGTFSHKFHSLQYKTYQLC